jgi:hypothetical protein
MRDGRADALDRFDERVQAVRVFPMIFMLRIL